jgi:hypothetical protein
MRSLQGKFALVTGAGRGIGAETAAKLTAAGARVLVNDLDEDAAQETAQQLDGAVAIAGDLTVPSVADDLIDAAIEQFGGLDIVVNNAGYVWHSAIHNMTDEQWDAMIDIHASAQFRNYNIKVERVSAVEGNPNNLPIISPYLEKYPGAVGCSLSHYSILKKAKELGLSNILVFEDDILFNEDWEKVYTENYKDIPEDWGMIYLSTNSVHKVITSRISDRIFKAHTCLTTHSYAIKKSR